MGVATAAKLFLYRSLWRGTGSRTAGRSLLDALDSDDETARTLAGMFLVQGGRRAVPLIEEALHKREHLPIALTIAGDLGEPELEAELRRYSDDPDPEVARAARDALAVMAAQRSAAARSS